MTAVSWVEIAGYAVVGLALIVAGYVAVREEARRQWADLGRYDDGDEDAED